MRWTLVMLAGLLALSAGCAANRNPSGDGEMDMAPSRRALQNEEAIKAGIGDAPGAVDMNDPNAGWSVPPGQSRPDRPDSDNAALAGEDRPTGAPGSNGMRPRDPAMSGGRPSGAAGTDSRSMTAGMSPTDSDVPPGSEIRRTQPVVKPLVPAFPARVRQERLTALRPVRFEFDSSDLGEDARAVLMNNAEWMKANPDVAVRVEGHADERGTPEYNLALGERRAKQVREYLITMGVDPANLITVSYGEEMPIDPASTSQAWSLNRRAEFSRSDNRAVSVNTSAPANR